MDASDSIAEQHGAVWGEHPNFSVNDWQYEVANGDTRRGYWDWVEAKIEEDQFD